MKHHAPLYSLREHSKDTKSATRRVMVWENSKWQTKQKKLPCFVDRLPWEHNQGNINPQWYRRLLEHKILGYNWLTQGLLLLGASKRRAMRYLYRWLGKQLKCLVPWTLNSKGYKQDGNFSTLVGSKRSMAAFLGFRVLQPPTMIV
jgi:hypothetical protein